MNQSRKATTLPASQVCMEMFKAFSFLPHEYRVKAARDAYNIYSYCDSYVAPMFRHEMKMCNNEQKVLKMSIYTKHLSVQEFYNILWAQDFNNLPPLSVFKKQYNV